MFKYVQRGSMYTYRCETKVNVTVLHFRFRVFTFVIK